MVTGDRALSSLVRTMDIAKPSCMVKHGQALPVAPDHSTHHRYSVVQARNRNRFDQQLQPKAVRSIEKNGPLETLTWTLIEPYSLRLSQRPHSLTSSFCQCCTLPGPASPNGLTIRHRSLPDLMNGPVFRPKESLSTAGLDS